MMTIHQRIKDGIELHRRLTGDAPDMVVLSESARKTFLDEALTRVLAPTVSLQPPSQRCLPVKSERWTESQSGHCLTCLGTTWG